MSWKGAKVEIFWYINIYLNENTNLRKNKSKRRTNIILDFFVFEYLIRFSHFYHQFMLSSCELFIICFFFFEKINLILKLFTRLIFCLFLTLFTFKFSLTQIFFNYYREKEKKNQHITFVFCFLLCCNM